MVLLNTVIKSKISIAEILNIFLELLKKINKKINRVLY